METLPSSALFAGKVMASVFWDILKDIDYIPKGHTIKGESMQNCWDSYERLWRPNTQGDWWKDIVSSGQWLVSMADIHNCVFELVDHHPLYSWFGSILLSSVLQREKNTWCGTSIVVAMTSNLLFMTFLKNKMEASSPMISKHCIIDRRSVWTTSGTILKNKPHLIESHERKVSLENFLLSLVFND